MDGKRLYWLRVNSGLTQEQLGNKININKHSISSYERNLSEPSDDIKIQISKIFNVSVDYLLGLTDEIDFNIDGPSYVILPKNLSKRSISEIKTFIEFQYYKDINNQTTDNNE